MNIDLKLPDYDLEERIYESERTVVYKARRRTDNYPVAIKIPRSEYPKFSDLVRFREQYTIVAPIDSPRVIKPISLEVFNNRYILIMERGGIDLKTYLNNRPIESVEIFFNIARQLVEILEELYHYKIIHKNIQPANILIDTNTGKIKIIDFSNASLLPKESSLGGSDRLEENLNYISPEQTGRMNRGVDYRGDFYSVGVTFFEILTGRLPFISAEPLEILHGHIAKKPPSILEIVPNLPPILDKIIGKLMAKNAEDRYQTPAGLLHDLDRCQRELEAKNITDFTLGTEDIPDRFLIPEKLYGREKEINILLATFERVAAGERELQLVRGFSGIGKTAVVNEVHKPIVRARGYFIRGKFDQFQRNIPLSAFIQSFRQLIAQLNGESDENLERWRRDILRALGENGKVITDVIPELSGIIGEQPEVARLSAVGTRDRFNLLFTKFIGVFATPAHPLVIFLDDLQWADSASLQLLQLLLEDINIRHLLIIGAYRDNEVSSAHPLRRKLDEIGANGIEVKALTLEPLSGEDINRLTADTLLCNPATARPLGEILYKKTAGNPFFTTRLLQSLHADGLINFDRTLRCWQCDMTGVKTLTVSDDVVEFMAGLLRKLPENSQNILKLAACIGNNFDLDTLAIVCRKTAVDTGKDLWEALKSGSILPVSDIYKFYRSGSGKLPATVEAETPLYRFLHDRVQQAAYSLIPANERSEIHLSIGRSLLNKIPDVNARIFDVVNQINLGLELVTNGEERLHFASLNAIAGARAKESTAYEAAANYYRTGIELLPADAWEKHYDLTRDLNLESAECEYLRGNFEIAENLFRELLTRVRTVEEKGSIYNLRLVLQTNLNLWGEVFDTGFTGLALLGIDLPRSGEALKGEIEKELEIAKEYARNIGEPLSLLNSPPVERADLEVAMNILMNLISPAYVSNQELCNLFVLKLANLSFRHGVSKASAFGFVWFGWLGMISDWLPRGYESGRAYASLALKLNERFRNFSLECKLYLLSGLVDSWREPIGGSIDYLLTSFERGVNYGDLVWAGYTAHHIFTRRIINAENLDSIVRECDRQSAFLQSTKDRTMYDLQHLLTHVIFNLQGTGDHYLTLDKGDFQAEHLVNNWKSGGFTYGIVLYNLYRLQLFYIYGEYDRAYGIARETEPLSIYIRAQITEVEFAFYYCAVVAALTRRDGHDTDYDRVLNTYHPKLAFWADNCPANFRHLELLIAAEREGLGGNLEGAIDRYDRAIEWALNQRLTLATALGNEMAARFWLSRNKPRLATPYLTGAYYNYARWGASGKIKHLEESYPDLSLNIPRSEPSTLDLDTITLLQAARTLSREIEIDRIISTLLNLVIENAGATKAVFISYRERQLSVEAIRDDKNTPIDSKIWEILPLTAINFVKNELKTIGIDDENLNDIIENDAYYIKYKPPSFICAPILQQGNLIAILYLENNLARQVFTEKRIEFLDLICAQSAICLENARLFNELELRVERRTRELKKAQEIANNANQAKSEFLSRMSHDLRTPLNSILGFCQLLEKDTELDKKQEKYIQSIHRSGDYLLNLIGDLLDLAKIEARKLDLEPRNVDLDTFLHDITSTYNFKTRELPIEFIFASPNPLPSTVHLDEKRLRQVLFNLLDNAVKFTAAGRVILTVETIEKIAPDTSILRFQVADTGIGIAGEDLEKIFRPFEQAGSSSQRAKGTGLGLSICQQIVNLMGSELKVSSTVGEGSVFYFDLELKSEFSEIETGDLFELPPPEIGERLLKACYEADLETIELLALELAKNDRYLALGEHLITLAGQYEFERIIELLTPKP